jgi:protein TonB
MVLSTSGVPTMPRKYVPMPKAVLAACLGLLLAAGCDRQQGLAEPVAGDASSIQAQAAGMDVDALRAAAGRAVREQRLYSPAGDNAIEWYLALRDRQPADAGLATTLLELEPYAVIAAEQSLARLEIDEAARLIALIARANPGASALPRLQALKLSAERKASEKPLPEAMEALAVAAQAQQEPPAPAALDKARVQAAKVEESAGLPVAPVVDPQGAALQVAVSPVTPPPAKASTEVQAPTPAPAVQAGRVPQLLQDRAPRYPAMALRRKLEGQVELSFTIKADGSVADVRVLSASPEGLFEDAAIATSRFWQFEALGRDVSSRRTIRFSLPKPAP